MKVRYLWTKVGGGAVLSIMIIVIILKQLYMSVSLFLKLFISENTNLLGFDFDSLYAAVLGLSANGAIATESVKCFVLRGNEQGITRRAELKCEECRG